MSKSKWWEKLREALIVSWRFKPYTTPRNPHGRFRRPTNEQEREEFDIAYFKRHENPTEDDRVIPNFQDFSVGSEHCPRQAWWFQQGKIYARHEARGLVPPPGEPMIARVVHRPYEETTKVPNPSIEMETSSTAYDQK